MQPLRLKFAIQGVDDSLSGATETDVELITPDWIRFTAPADALESPGADPMSTFIKQYRVVMFIYIEPSGAPIQTVGRISICEPSMDEDPETYSIVAEFQEISDEGRRQILDYMESHQGIKIKDRRRQVRRRGDLFLRELQSMLQILLDMSRGSKVEFGEQFANLVGRKDTLGRRVDDKKNAEVICHYIEQLGSALAQHFGKETGLRHVSIRKVKGKTEAAITKDKVLSGWEEALPQAGKIYCLYLHGGGIFRSTPVIEVQNNSFRTRNSLYEVHQIKA